MTGMGDTPSHGQQRADSSGKSGDAAPETENLADVLSAIRGLAEKVAALESSVPATVNKALTARLKREQPKDDEGGDGGGDAAPAKGGKPSADPAVATLQRQLATLQSQLAAKDAETKAAGRERALRAAIATSGVPLVDQEAAYRVLVADFEPDEDGGLRARDPAQQAKPLDSLVKSRLTAMPYLHAPTGKAGGGGAGNARPAGGSDYRWDTNLPHEENVRLWRESKARATAAG